MQKNFIAMCIDDINGTIIDFSDYDVEIDFTYYNQDYDFDVFDIHPELEQTTTQTDILFE